MASDPLAGSIDFHAMVYLVDCNVLSRRCRIILEERAERAEPGFVASPALDGLAINRLLGLPLARRLHGTRIEFRAKAGVVPGQAAAAMIRRITGARVRSS